MTVLRNYITKSNKLENYLLSTGLYFTTKKFKCFFQITDGLWLQTEV